MTDISSSGSSSLVSTPSTPPSSLSSPEVQNLNLGDPVSITEEARAEAAKLKAQANKSFTSNDFVNAVRLYSEAIDKNPSEPTLWCNRAYARMKLEEYGYALSDTSQAIQLDPKYAKAYYRHAICHLQILKPQAAVADFKKVLLLEPKNETVRTQLVATQKLIRRIEFEKAIELEEEKNSVDRCREIIAEGGCEVDKTYTGPKLPVNDGKYSITHEFVKDMIQWFKNGKTLPKRYVWEIVLGAHEEFVKEETLVDIDIPDEVTIDVIGDVHGQFYDLLHLYTLTGEPSASHYLLMNGDLVDRGSWSIEVILTAFAYKWLHPRYMYINRGNHEAKEMNRTYGFEGEAKQKHGEQTYKLFAHVFTTLPLATLVNATKPPTIQRPSDILSPQGRRRYFVVHGGLFSKDDVTLEDVRKIERVGRQPGTDGLMCELLWTDPQFLPGRGPSKRGVGIAFGPDVTKKWCKFNGISGVIRSHEWRLILFLDGYQVEHDGLCITVFSAPNYVDQAGNKGAFVRINSEGDLDFVQFEASPHPPMRPMALSLFFVFLIASSRRMDKTKSKLAAFFENDDEESSFPQKPVDDAKVSQYTSGKVRKSRREKELEAAEAKKREEEANAAKAYAEFLDAFEGEDVGRRKTGSTFVKSTSEGSKTAYNPGKAFEKPSRTFEELVRTPSPPLSAPKPKGKRAMDQFLEEIKKEQAEREARFSRQAQGHGRSVTAMAAYEGQSGSKDRGDPQTSNLFVANLPANVTEQSLGQFFARCGPVGSVKVMWPRGDGSSGPGADMTASRRTRNAGLSGFVSFMKRKDAEKALREYDGYDWGGSILRVGWSKAVPIAAKPMYVSSSSRKDSWSRSRSRSRSRDHQRSRSRDRFRSRRSPSSSWSRSRSRSRRRSYSRSHRRRSRSRSRRRHSRSPNPAQEAEAVTDVFIRAVAAEVKGHGTKYEANLKERERNNPKYTFMLKKDHRRHAFYRGLIESEKSLEPEFDDEGYNSVYSTDSAEESERERVQKTHLGKLARRRFEAMLRSLTGKRGEMARCMTFCLEHAEAAHEVVDVIVASLLVDGTAVPRKVARLHLICDILHNSAASVPSAWKFRQEFQSRLGIVFDHLANIYHSFPGRITAETFKKQITAVVDIWEDWIVFPLDFTSELRLRLEGATVESEKKPEEVALTVQKSTDDYSSRFKSSTFQLATEPARADSNVSGSPDDGEPMEMDSENEGEPDIEETDGVPIDDVDGEPVDDIDGEPLKEYLDGEPVYEDVDGEPVDDVDGIPAEES
ncbi:hypothetical protein AX17_001437 [Amanita inopinata Kibby_2008]|nr:hypothetical protein AX17_001437 [Amanita inopinata Kibby_2008]